MIYYVGVFGKKKPEKPNIEKTGQLNEYYLQRRHYDDEVKMHLACYSGPVTEKTFDGIMEELIDFINYGCREFYLRVEAIGDNIEYVELLRNYPLGTGEDHWYTKGYYSGFQSASLEGYSKELTPRLHCECKDCEADKQAYLKRAKK